MEEPLFHEHVHPRRGRFWLAVPLVLLALVVVWDIGFGLRALSTFGSAKRAVEESLQEAARFSFADAAEGLQEAEAAFGKTAASLDRLLILDWIPGLRGSILLGKDLAHAGEDLAGIGWELLDAAEHAASLGGDPKNLFVPQLDRGEFVSRFRELDRDTRLLLLSRFHALLPRVEEVSSTLRVASTRFAELEESPLLWVVRKDKAAFQETMERLEAVVRGIGEALAFVPILTQGNGQSRILVELLNNAELRPGGGFLGSFAIVELDAGILSSITAYDVMAVDGPATGVRNTAPPAPLSEYLGVSTWFLRDANWSPDFAVSSQQVLRFLDEELAAGGARAPFERKPFDAVLAVTPSFASDVLNVIGPVEVDGQVFNAENIYDTLQFAVEKGFAQDGLPPEQRKEVIGKLLEVVAARLPFLNAAQWNELFVALDQDLLEKQVLFYSPYEETQALIERLRWGGRVSEDVVGDYLQVVDSNLAALKSDPAVKRDISYAVSETEDGLLAEVRVKYRHTKPFDWKTTRYRTYLQVYVPLGSTLISTEGTLANDKLHNPKRLPDMVDIADELGKTRFGMFTAIEPLSTREVVVRYRLPDRLQQEVREGSYELLVQKQPGAQRNGLTLDLDFAKKLSRATPAEESGEWGDDRYRLNTILDQDRRFTVAW